MRVNVIQTTDKGLIVVTMTKEEAMPLLGLAEWASGGCDDVECIANMRKLEALLESGIEEIEQVIEVEYPCEN
jgi:hypothetical protein